MFVYELKDSANLDRAFWAEVITHEAEAVQTRLNASKLDWELVTPPRWRDKDLFIVRVPLPIVDSESVRTTGPLVLNAAKGLTAVIKRPKFLTDTSVGRHEPKGFHDDARTMPNTDARAAEAALLKHIAENVRRPAIGRIRDLARLYLRALSVVQDRFGVRGNGKQSLRFISHFWHLGDKGVAARFEKVAANLNKGRIPNPEPTQRSVILGSTSQDSLKTRLETLEHRLARRGPQ